MTQTISLIFGIFVLCSFYTFTAIFRLKHGLPKKETDYIRIQHLLNNKAIEYAKAKQSPQPNSGSRAFLFFRTAPSLVYGDLKEQPDIPVLFEI